MNIEDIVYHPLTKRWSVSHNHITTYFNTYKSACVAVFVHQLKAEEAKAKAKAKEVKKPRPKELGLLERKAVTKTDLELSS